jgi:phosphatidylglycerophosphate synthase
VPKAWLKQRHQDRILGPHFFSALNGRLATPWTRLFLALRLTPNQVSVLALLVSLAGAWLVASDPYADWTPWLGGLLFMVGIWWDHSDGQVARATGKGSLRGALFDTVLDRWIEMLWIGALALGPFVGDDSPLRRAVHPGWVVAAGLWALQANFYLRWINVQNDLYNVRKELLAGRSADGDTVRLPPRRAQRTTPRMFYIPLAPTRDLSFWMLAAVTWSPWWLEGLAVYAAFHMAVGLERTYYAMRDAGRAGTNQVRAFLDPDYHK